MVYPKKAFFNNYFFLVGEHVYEPAEDTYLIADKMSITEDDVVLDMGTGCGVLAVLAAKKAKNVVAVDIIPMLSNLPPEMRKLIVLKKKSTFVLETCLIQLKTLNVSA